MLFVVTDGAPEGYPGSLVAVSTDCLALLALDHGLDLRDYEQLDLSAGLPTSFRSRRFRIHIGRDFVQVAFAFLVEKGVSHFQLLLLMRNLDRKFDAATSHPVMPRMPSLPAMAGLNTGGLRTLLR